MTYQLFGTRFLIASTAFVMTLAACSHAPSAPKSSTTEPPMPTPVAASSPAPVVNGETKNFGHFRLPITEGSEKAKVFKTSFNRDLKKDKTESYYQTIVYDFEMPASTSTFTFRIRVSQLVGSGCVKGVPSPRYYLQTGVKKDLVEVGRGEGSVFKVLASVKTILVAKIDNSANCDHLDYALAVSRE